MNTENFHSLFIVPDDKRKFFKWSLRWFNEKYPKIGVTMIRTAEKALSYLKKKHYFRIYWFENTCALSPQAIEISKQYPKLEWILITEKLDVYCYRAWVKAFFIKGIWYLPDFLNFDLWSFILITRSNKQIHSPAVQKVLEKPKRTILPKDIRLLKALQAGKTRIEIEKTIGFSTSNYYYRLECLKKLFGLLPEANLYQLICEAESWGYIPS